jgi:CRP/FNR family transcriptional regulator, cyclic AMP receptor protein
VPSTPEPATLSEVSLFRGLSPEELERLAPLLRERTFSAGASVVIAEQPGEAIFVVLEGSVKVHLEQPDADGVILAVLGPGEVVGEMSLADSLGRSASVRTLEETRFVWAEGATLREALLRSPTMALNLANLLSRRLRLTNTHLRSVAALDVPGRVAAQLVAFAQEYGEEEPGVGVRIPLHLTQTDLAGLVGASRVRVNQTLGFFRRHKFISIDEDGRIVVHDQGALARRAR